jgi:hypothetical protein
VPKVPHSAKSPDFVVNTMQSGDCTLKQAKSGDFA